MGAPCIAMKLGVFVDSDDIILDDDFPVGVISHQRQSAMGPFWMMILSKIVIIALRLM